MKLLRDFDLPHKILITGFLLVLSTGFGVAQIYLRYTTSKADGVDGLGMDDITATYHGLPNNTAFKKNVLGAMNHYFGESQDPGTPLTAEEKADVDACVAWNNAGAPENGYWDMELKEKTKDKKYIHRIMLNRGCYDCHAADATMKGNKKDSPLDTYVGMAKVLKPDTGMPVHRLLSLMHIHLLGMGMMITLVVTALSFTSWPSKWKTALILAGLSSVILDVCGWAAVKWGGGNFAPIVMLGGAMMAASFGLSVALTLYDIWLKKPKPPAAA